MRPPSLPRRAADRFFAWYERRLRVNIALAAGLFALQLVHLAWLTLDVVAERLTGTSVVGLGGALRWPIVVVDYTEIPALVSVSLVYLNELRKAFALRHVVALAFLNSQWLHIFWITDEFVVGERATTLPAWLAWVAIAIDYLELPVIVDTVRRFAVEMRRPRP